MTSGSGTEGVDQRALGDRSRHRLSSRSRHPARLSMIPPGFDFYGCGLEVDRTCTIRSFLSLDHHQSSLQYVTTLNIRLFIENEASGQCGKMNKRKIARRTGTLSSVSDKIGAERRCPIGDLKMGGFKNQSTTKMGPKKINNKLTQQSQTMGNAALKKHVATADKTGVLNLSRSKLDEFPEEVMRLKGNLRSLDLAYNKLSSLTPEIGDFSSMKSLVLDHNSLSSLPHEIGKLAKLETLSVVGNKLKTLPNSLENCGNLKQVLLQSNQLKEFPVMLCRLKHLDLLDLSSNQVTRIPKESQHLHVTELNMNQNRLDDIAPEIARAPRLKTLRVQENCLTISGIPTAILTDSCVSTLAVEGNLFDMRQFTHLEGYDQYQERFTAVKKKLS